MKVLLLAKYDQAGASSRYRTLQYLDYLKNNNIEVTVNSLLDSAYITRIYAKQKPSLFYYLKQCLKRAYLLLFKSKHYDLCWIEGELFPYLPFFLEQFLLPKKFVAEYDDAIFHNYNMHRHGFIRKLLGNKIAKIMRKAQHVIVGNEYVKNYAAEAGAANITIIPTVVDAEVYQPKSSQADKQKIIIGWLGSPTTVKYMALIEDVLRTVAKKANIKLCIIGGEYQIDGIETLNHHWPDKWSEAEEIALLKEIDIGIMPLIDSPWEKGKCGFKLIKYMACGKPVIASPVSSNLEIVQHGQNGYLAANLKEWEEYLLMLISNTVQCKEFGNVGRKYMVEKYSLQANAPILCNILETAK